FGVVCQDLAFYTVFQWCDDRAAVRIVLGVSGEDEKHVQRHSQFESPDLDVAFFQNIEEGYLYTCLQVGYFIDDEDASVAFWDDPEMDHLLVCEVQSEVGRFDGVDVPDEVGNADVGCSQLFSIAFRAVQPADGGFVALGSYQITGKFRDGLE